MSKRTSLVAAAVLLITACSGAGGGGSGTLTVTIDGKAFAFDGVSCSVDPNASNLTVAVGDESAGDYVKLEAGSRIPGQTGVLSGGGTFHDFGLLGRQGDTTFGLDPDSKLTIELPSDLRSGKFSGGVRFGTVGHRFAKGTMTGSFAC